MKRVFDVALISACLCTYALAPVHASAAGDDKRNSFTVSRPTDLNMDCDQLWNEAFTMKEVIARTQNTRQDSKMQARGIGVLGTAASYLVGTVTGGLSIAAAGMIAKEAASEKEQNAEEIQDIAEQRRALMVGIFNIRKCEGDIDQALVDEKHPDPIQKLADMSPAAGPVLPKKREYND